MLKDILVESAKYVCVFLVSVILLLILSVGTEFISTDAMKENMLSSAKTMCENTVGIELWKGIPASKLDRYADCISLNIAWHTDPGQPFRSAMWSGFYYSRDPMDENGANEDLMDAVRLDKEENIEYLRYWHGNAALIRLFHLFTDITGMYSIAAIILILLLMALLVLLWRFSMKAEAVCLVTAAAMAGIWFVPLCIEYVWVFVISFGVSIPALILCRSGKWNRIWILFLISGIITNYLDFLTNELLTLLIPLLLVIAIISRMDDPENGSVRAVKDLSGNKEGSREINSPGLTAIKSCILWGIGYAGMWVMKWILAGAILNIDVRPYISGHIAERIGVSEYGLGSPLQALFINLITILPVGAGDIWAVIFLTGIVILICFLIVYRKKRIRKEYVITFALLGLLPYIRYMILFDHSFRHFFFTYRAQMATALAIGLITLEVADGRLFARKAR